MVLVAFLAGVAADHFVFAPVVSDESRPTLAGGQAATPGDPAASTAREQALEEALEGSKLTTLWLAARADSLEALLEGLRGGDLDHRRVVDHAIENLDEQELRSIVASAANLSPEELEEVQDLPAFAARLAEVAMEDMLEPGEPVTGANRVVFTTTPETRDPEARARSRFAREQNRIYAAFPTADYEQDSVMIKWYRSDPPQILLFERYPIRRGEAHGFVWLQPTGGWEPGRYQVDIYAADEAVTRLAQGRYTIEQ
jgi:hypothetical protein